MLFLFRERGSTSASEFFFFLLFALRHQANIYHPSGLSGRASAAASPGRTPFRSMTAATYWTSISYIRTIRTPSPSQYRHRTQLETEEETVREPSSSVSSNKVAYMGSSIVATV
ncbi:hypothetical protein BJ166DRAFT_510256 [Pestalotiopsis sp. NC0098]|nr:hypothetical protein BJ166DRAFT_510256 [Pestalotiopsis sp. NC0098]